MKLCSLSVAFKFGTMDPIRQIANLKSSPKFQCIWYSTNWQVWQIENQFRDAEFMFTNDHSNEVWAACNCVISMK